ncbi:MAG: nucleotide exchange factor GrpE [bacterium]|nr:nucleotide exchange factor GrpE [bacterium]
MKKETVSKDVEEKDDIAEPVNTGDSKAGEDESLEKETARDNKNAEADDTYEEGSVDELTKILSEKEDEVSRVNKELDSMKDLLQRRQADFENFKKRTLKLQEDYKKVAVKDFALDIIMINDDLIRAIEASSNINKEESGETVHDSFAEGVSMISKRIEETLGKYGIVEIEAAEQEFDPNFHEAVEIEAIDSVSVDTVTKVYQKGFRIEDLVVRSAKVRVAKPMSQAPPVESETPAEEEEKAGEEN